MSMRFHLAFLITLGALIQFLTGGDVHARQQQQLVYVWKGQQNGETKYYWHDGSTSYVPPFPDTGWLSLEDLWADLQKRYPKVALSVDPRYPSQPKPLILPLNADDMKSLRKNGATMIERAVK